MRILIVIGTRPEAIKLAPVVHALRRCAADVSPVVVVTGQHREMLDPMLELFDLWPDYDLDVMRPEQSLTDVATAVMSRLDPVLLSENPDWVLVQGDTTTVMAASLAAFHRRLRVGHVEAGLRTFDRYSPYPEEINRRIAGMLADIHFAPTPRAVSNLLAEGVEPERVHLTGNTVIDSMHHVRAAGHSVDGSPLADLPEDVPLVLVTAHRGENHGAPMRGIAGALRRLALDHRVHLVVPLHLNPAVHRPLVDQLGGLENVSLLGPLEYPALIWLLDRVRFVVTDSGGLQEEAAGMGRPALILRATTERPEGIEAGVAKLIGTAPGAIVREAGRLIADDVELRRMTSASGVYGDGHAAERIVDALLAESGAAIGVDESLPATPGSVPA